MSASPISQGAAPTDLLEKLRDVQAPPPASWWPPAPGWWLLAFAGIACLLALFVWLQRRKRRLEGKKEAEHALRLIYVAWQNDSNEEASTERYVHEVMKLLRRVAIHSLGREQIARLTGKSFIERLNSLSTTPISSEAGDALVQANYRPRADFDVEAFHGEAESWLRGLGVPNDA